MNKVSMTPFTSPILESGLRQFSYQFPDFWGHLAFYSGVYHTIITLVLTGNNQDAAFLYSLGKSSRIPQLIGFDVE
jgi:hypothetical protein